MQINRFYQKIAYSLKTITLTFFILLGSSVIFKSSILLLALLLPIILMIILTFILLLRSHTIDGQKQYSYQILQSKIKKSIKFKNANQKIRFIFSPKRITIITFWIGFLEVITYFLYPLINPFILLLALVSLIYLLGLISYYTIVIVYKIQIKEIDLSFMIYNITEIT